MSTAENDIAQDMAEHAYRKNQINALEFRRRMYALGVTREACDDILEELDGQKAEAARQRIC